jgi:hypothetical protein
MPQTLSQQARHYSRTELRRRLDRSIDLQDFAHEFPIQWIEETEADGRLSPGPGLGQQAFWMHHNCTASTGVELTCADPYYAEPDYLAGVQRALSGAFAEMRYDEQFQLLLTTWDEAHSLWDRLGAARPEAPAYSNWWRRQRAERERGRMATGDLRRFRSFLFVNNVPGEHTKDPYGLALRGPGQLWGALDPFIKMMGVLTPAYDGLTRAHYLQAAAEATRRNQTLASLLGAGGLLRAKPVRAQTVLDLLRRQWSPEWWRRNRLGLAQEFWPAPDYRTAPFAAHFLRETVDDAGALFRVGKVWHRILTMSILPDEATVGEVAMGLMVGENARTINQFEVAMILKPSDRAAAMEKIRARIRVLHGLAQSGPEYAENVVLMQQYQQRLVEIRTATRPVMFDCHLQLHLWHESPQILENWEQLLRAQLDNACGLVLEPEELHALPFHVGYGQPGYTRFDDQSRMATVIPAEASVLAPLAVNSEGCLADAPDADVPLVLETDLGTPYGLDLFATGRVANFGGVGIGTPGSGKTNFYNSVAVAYAGWANVVIIDGADQPGFGTTCQLLGGSYVRTGEMRVNPLGTRVVDGRQLPPTEDELRDIIVTLSALVGPLGAGLSPLQESVLTGAVRHAFEHRTDPQGRVILEHLVPALEPGRYSDETERSIAVEFRRIITETGLGLYGEKLNGADTHAPAKFTVYEVTDLFKPGSERLAAVVISSLVRSIERLTQEGQASGARRKTVVIIDEAWKALLNRSMLGQVMRMYRTGRARWMSPHLLSQSLEDVKDLIRLSAEGESTGRYDSSPILASSSHFFLFKLSDEDARMAGETFALTEEQRGLLSRLTGKPGEWKEFVHLCKVADGQPRTFARLRSRLLPAEIWATSTSAVDDMKRTAAQRAIEREIAQDPAAKGRWLQVLQAAGWPVRPDTDPGQFIGCAVLHALTQKQNL